MQDFKQLKVWQKSHRLTLLVYQQTRGFPRDELYGLTSQLRRASSSIPANIAEGCGRSSDKQFAQFLQIAAGSASETEYHLLLAKDLGYLQQNEYELLNSVALEVKRMLASFLKKLKADS